MNMNAQIRNIEARGTQLVTTFFLLISLMVGFGTTSAEAKPKNSDISLVPTVTNIVFQNGQLLASGTVNAIVKGKSVTAPFSGVPVNITLASNQVAGADCPILDLHLGPITVDLLGLVVETSQICLEITAHHGEGLLGDLLCAVGNLLNGGLTLDQILNGTGLLNPVTGAVALPGLTGLQLNALLGGLTNLLNGVLGNLLNAVLADVLDGPQNTRILHLVLGPLDLNLLGLEVILDNCDNGPVTVDITAVHGGGLLGNLLSSLLHGGGISLGDTLGQILGAILGRLPGL